MARLGSTFDATKHDTTQSDYSELPNGDYELEIEASEVKEGANGTGLKTTMTVLRPEEYQGRKVFNFYNLEHKNAQAQEIGQRQFASLCRAIGVSEVEDSEELHFKAFTAKIGLGKPSKDGQYPARAEIKKYYFPDEGNVPQPSIDANQPVAQARPANDNRPAAANSNKPAPAAAAAGKKRPWG
ncbi:DUF669 domain-containing protein [Brucella sp. NBRC 113783]|uniref:DUF669 domain-containing protein n=1 Tax=Brucella sp. NBRC 113783 TaxID=3075478 RepID=UPI0029BFD5D8|nr:DUF669 domain-containing protein [Brucella sp. NBRC 113783]MDX4074633.1 DUF669 domain-containing protein [Brucella sp. NBRC 113783]